jgi:glycosyltransferase involved in cell wall biosynthesis
MRVALITETFLPKVDGIVTVIMLLLDHLAQRGVESVILVPDHGPVEDCYANTRVIKVPGLVFPFYKDARLGFSTPAAVRELRAYRPDVVHIFHPAWFGVQGMLMAKSMGAPVLASFHLDMARTAQHLGHAWAAKPLNWYTKTVFNRADGILAPSRLVQREMQRIGVREVDLWRRGVDAERFHPRYRSASMREMLSEGHPDETLLLYVGRLSHEKQLHHLRPVLEQVPGTRLALVGNGPARAELQQVFTGLPVHFTGFLSGEPLLQAYASADVFVFPSALETFGLVVLEAMAAGLPVVASRVGGVAGVVQEGDTGFTFEPGDVAALIDSVRRIAASREQLAVMRSDARTFAETQSWPAMMDEVIDGHYARLAGLRRK